MQNDEVTFNVFEAMEYPMDNEDCFCIDVIKELMRKIFREGHSTLPLDACITLSDTSTIEDNEIKECV